MTEPTITYDEMKAALEKDACGRETEPELFALLDKLNPTPPLFGRWAEHPHHGRGVIISNALNEDRWVRFAHKIKAPGDNIGINYVDYAHLKTDPALLDTYADFNDAPNAGQSNSPTRSVEQGGNPPSGASNSGAQTCNTGMTDTSAPSGPSSAERTFLAMQSGTAAGRKNEPLRELRG